MFLISDAMAQTADAAAGGAGGLLMQIVPIVLIFVVFWFFLIRPQQKRQKEHMKMCSALAKGDEILTLGGIAGRIADLNDQYIVIEISRVDDKPVTITMQRGAVQTVLPKGTIKSI
ncbi:preprotein translocase subunit YajC [Duodenibacillus massiliensis]|uniref:preprotein translocase subunit YajC n=1 Tax=Duodenibacillus massiliensis TaxID=1852381 RepID=UPI00307BB934